MTTRYGRAISLLCGALLLSAIACDPEMLYRPVNLDETDDKKWSARLGSVEIRMDEISGLAYSTSIFSTFEIINRGPAVASIEGAELVGVDQTYSSSLPGNGELRWRSADPGTRASISLLWKLEDAAVEVLGDRPSIILDLRVGEERQRVHVEYERAK